MATQNFILGDCMDFMRQMKEDMKWHYYDIAIVDPEYGINVGKMNLGATKDSKPRKFEMGNWDTKIPDAEYFELLKYVSKYQIIWGGNYFLDYLGNTKCIIIWDKMSDGLDFADFEMAWTNLNKQSFAIRRHRSKDRGEEKRHPTQKPVYLYDKLHLECVEKGWRVLDTHGGSHSHAIAAARNNVNLDIIEKFEPYHISGKKAYDLSIDVNQGNLFG